MLVLLVILFNVIYCSSGLNLTYYPVVVQSTKPMNVSSFEECACQCLSSTDCSYFAYWSSISLSPLCQIYSSSDSKPDIIAFTLTNYSNQTGLYGIITSNTSCQLSIPNASYTYNNNASSYVSTSGKRIISVIVMSIANSDRLLAIDSNNFSYYIFNINTFQLIDNDTFSPKSCQNPLCAQQFNNLLYIGCSSESIEVRQFNNSGNNSQLKPQILYSLTTNPSGAPQGLAILSNDIIYYVIGNGDVYVLLTASNTSKPIYSFTGFTFASPSVVIALDSFNMNLYLATNNGTLFRIELSSININNGTSRINSSIDQYQMASIGFASIYIDSCYRLWVLSSPGNPKPQMTLFVQQNNLKTFSSMNIINYTNSLPTFPNAPYNFQFDNNYSLFTANVEQGLYAFYRK